MSTKIPAIIRQIVDRDCHISMSNRDVVRHVISKLQDGFKTFRSMEKADRRAFIAACIAHHQSNLLLYCDVSNGVVRDTVTLPPNVG